MTNPFEDEATAGAGVDLSEFDDDFQSAEAPGFDELPDGKYQIRIDRAVIANSQAGNPLIKWELVVISGASEGRKLFKNSVITESSIPFVKGDLLKVGLDIEKLSILPERIGEVLDKTLEVTKKTKGEFTNIYFNRLLDVPAGDPDIGSTPWE